MKTIICTVLILFSFLPFQSFGQGQGKPNFVGQWYQSQSQGKSPVRSDAFQADKSDYPRTKRYNLKANINQLNSIMNTRPDLVNITIPYGGRTYTLNLARVEVASDDFSVKTNKGNANHDSGVQYRGIVDNNPAQIASMSLTKTDKSAFFSTGEGNFVITKEGNDYVAYNQQDQEAPVTYCLTPDINYEVPSQSEIVAAPLTSGCQTVNVYFECDYAFYQSKGSSASAVTDYVMSFFNQVATLYANESISIQVSQVYVWTTPDPYGSLTTPSAILNSFRTTRGTNFNGQLAHFLTTRNVGGGIAYVDVICNKAYAYGVSMVYGTYSNVPTYSWTINVVTHELGHNLGSPHTHSCSWTGGPIDNCKPPEGSCSPGPAPVNGGTIMSYCHTTSYGINFNNGFGPQPGNLIRARVQAATCLPTSSAATPPTSLSTNNITTSSATLAWAAVSGASTYTVQYKLASSSAWITSGTTSSINYNLTGLSQNTSYNWTVKADCSAFAPTANFTTTGSMSCAAPTSLSTANISQTGATLNWAAVSGATGYTVQYKTIPNTTWTTVNATTNSLSISGLFATTGYVWQVKASCSVYSAQSSFTTSGSTTCSPPTGLSTTNITQTGATLNWTIVSGATGYTVQYKTSSASTWSMVNATVNSIALSGLSASTGYVWQVKASCSAGYSTQSSFTTSGTTGCSAPTGLTTSGITSSAANLNWSSVIGATSYTLQYRPTSTTAWTTLTTSTNSRSLSGLTAGTNYIWQVKASCSSSYSFQASFTTTNSSGGCTAPTGLVTSNISSTGATLSWSAVNGATSYTIQYRRSTVSTWSTTTTSTTSKTLSGLVAGGSYVWQVKASCSSSYSAQATFTTNTTSTSGCAVPTNLNTTNITSSAATLSWSGPANAVGYSIRYRLVGASGWSFITNATGSSYRLTNLYTKRNYEWAINAKCSDGTNSNVSGTKTFTTL